MSSSFSVEPTPHVPWIAENLFANTTAIVTGAGSGIGRTIACSLGKLGAHVAICDLSERDAAATAERIISDGGKATSIPMNVADEEPVRLKIHAFGDSVDGIDFVVNCAGVMLDGILEDIDGERWRRSFAVNVDGTLNVSRAALPHLRNSERAAIVNIGSTAALSAYPGGGGYGPSKRAVVALSQQMAVEWGPEGIRVNVINPGPTMTPLFRAAQSDASIERRARRTPLGRLSTTQNIADAALFLLSPGATSISGQAIEVDGGLSQTLQDGVASWSSRHQIVS